MESSLVALVLADDFCLFHTTLNEALQTVNGRKSKERGRKEKRSKRKDSE